MCQNRPFLLRCLGEAQLPARLHKRHTHPLQNHDWRRKPPQKRDPQDLSGGFMIVSYPAGFAPRRTTCTHERERLVTEERGRGLEATDAETRAEGLVEIMKHHSNISTHQYVI